MGRLNPSRETKFSGTYGDRGIFAFPVQLTTSRIGNLTRFIHTLLYVMIIYTAICTWYRLSLGKYALLQLHSCTFLQKLSLGHHPTEGGCAGGD